MFSVAILDDYQQVALTTANWGSLGPQVKVQAFDDNLVDVKCLAERLRDFDAAVLMRERTPFMRPLFERLPNLRLLVTAGMRNRSIDLAAAVEHGVLVTGTETSGYSTVEVAVGLIISLLRRMPWEMEGMRNGKWQTGLGQGLEGKTLGVLGVGKLGSRVAAVAKLLGMEVIAWSQNLTPQKAADAGVTYVSKEKLLESSDVVTIHLVLSDRTRGLIGSAELQRMKPTAYLVNTSRGPIVQEAALLGALGTRQIAGAALDVYDQEPLPSDHPLRKLDNVLLTPHIGYVTVENYHKIYCQAVENIRAFLEGKPIRVLQ